MKQHVKVNETKHGSAHTGDHVDESILDFPATKATTNS